MHVFDDAILIIRLGKVKGLPFPALSSSYDTLNVFGVMVRLCVCVFVCVCARAVRACMLACVRV